ncbi:hypothetical protein BLD48_07510 [Exiguobacterium sp. KRL4]|nr:hypothetical protein BLD48_07510 [Exiguobacterium sp. KRL4]
MDVKIRFPFLLFEIIRCTRLLQEKAQVPTALSETNKTRFSAHMGQENWLVSRLRKASAKRNDFDVG